MTEKEEHPAASHFAFPYYFADAGAECGPDWTCGVDGIHFGYIAPTSLYKYDLAIYYDSLAGDDFIDCRCSRWDTENYSVTVETWLKKSQLDTLLSNITLGATGELYQILGRPKYYDKTWTGKNTLRLLPIPSSTKMNRSTLKKMRKETLIYPKNVSYSPVKGSSGWINTKIEGYISGSKGLAASHTPTPPTPPEDPIGDGSSGNPYKIWDWEDLYNIRNDLDAYYKLMVNLDSSTHDYDDYASSTANGGQGWDPIGTSEAPFTGNFNGNNKTISDLYIDRDNTTGLGLFKSVGGNALLYNFGVINVDIRGTYSGNYIFAGALIGECIGATVTNCWSSGTIDVVGYTAGGLVGILYTSNSTFINCYSSVSVTATTNAAGLISDSEIDVLTLTNCYATGNCTSSSNSAAGLISFCRGGIFTNCYATGNVSAPTYAAGFIARYSQDGSNYIEITECYATGTVTCSGTYAGGFIARSDDYCDISECYSTGTVTGTNYIGGFFGYLIGIDSDITNCYSTGDVTRSSGTSTSIGGFCGYNYRASITKCYSIGLVTVGALTSKGFCGFVDTGSGYEDVGNFWDTQTSNQSTSAGNAAGKTTAEMYDIDTFTAASWDIVLIGSYINEDWYIDDGNDYPHLGWEL